AAALGTYARLEPADAVAVLTPWLDKPSRNETLRSAALSGLGSLKDPTLLDTLIAWTKPGKPRACRSAALTAVARLAQSANPNEEQRKRIFAAVSACMEEDGSRLRTSAIFALRDLGKAATPALATLDALSLHDPSSRIRDLAKRTAEQIRTNPQAP